MSNFLVTGTSPDDYAMDDMDDLEPEDTARAAWIEESDELPQNYGRKIQPPMRQPLRPDIVLSNGTIIRYEYALNGSQNAFPVGRESRAMTEEEYAEWEQIFRAPVKSPDGEPGVDW